MEEEGTRDYNEPCSQCSDIAWGLTDEDKFYCRTCHNVIDKSVEVLSRESVSNARAHSISRGLKKKPKFEKGWEWYICEGFQCVLQKQAEALQSLGVSSQMKDEVLCNLWRNYLQKSKQAFCDKPSKDALPFSDDDSEVNTETDLPSDASIREISSAASTSGSSHWSGSVDGSSYFMNKKKRDLRMSLPMTLAFCYLALLWLRESITLSDLLRLVMDGHIPYLNVYKDFPEEMKVYGTDFKIFHAENWPMYEDINKKMESLATYLDLPRFPDITEDSFLHPDILCMKYLMEANLPDDMHAWTCRVVQKTGIGEADFLTLQPGNKSLPSVKYDAIAVAVVIVVLKILFVLDDQAEWRMSNYAEERNKNSQEGYPIFDIKKWYEVVKKAVDVEQKKLEDERVRYLWKCEKPLFHRVSTKSNVLKKRHMVTVLQGQFRSLSGTVEPTEKRKPSSFQFNWTEENQERPCFHGHRLDGIVQQLIILDSDYWLCTSKLCKKENCGHLAHYKESEFPHTYRFVLRLFSFILRIDPSVIHEEVCALEHRLFYSELCEKSRIASGKEAESLKGSKG